LLDLSTVAFNHHIYKNSLNNNNKKKTNRASVLEDFMTVASDAAAKSTLI